MKRVLVLAIRLIPCLLSIGDALETHPRDDELNPSAALETQEESCDTRVESETFVWRLREFPTLELPGGGSMPCADIPLEPAPRCVLPQAEQVSVCPGGLDVKRIYDPAALQGDPQRNFRCLGKQLCCVEVNAKSLVGDQNAYYHQNRVAAEEIAQAAASYGKYEDDVYNYRQVFPQMDLCEGETRSQCLTKELQAFHDQSSYCEGDELSDAMKTKCLLTAMQNRIATSGLFYTYDNQQLPDSANFHGIFEKIFPDHQRPADHSPVMGDYWKDPYETMKDGQGDCEDMAFIMNMYCQSLVNEKKLDGQCLMVCGTVHGGGGHAISVYKDANGEAYVLDGTYYDETDTTTLTDDRMWNPNELMPWQDYIGNCGAAPCREFAMFGSVKATPGCWDHLSNVNCKFSYDNTYSDPQWEHPLDHYSDSNSIQHSMSGVDLNTLRYHSKGLSVPLDKFCLNDIGTYFQAQYVAASLTLHNPKDVDIYNKNSVALWAQDWLHVAESMAGAWVSAIFAYHQLRESKKKREALGLLGKLLELDDDKWARKRFEGNSLRRMLHLMADVFCSDDPQGEVQCFNAPDKSVKSGDHKVANALVLFHRRDATFSSLHELCEHVQVRLDYLRTLFSEELEALTCGQFDRKLLAGMEKKSGEKVELKKQLREAAKSVGISWKSKRISVGFRTFWNTSKESGLPPKQYKLTRRDGDLIKQLGGIISTPDIQEFLTLHKDTVKVLASLSSYNQYEQDHWRLQSIWKAGVTTAISFVPLFGAVDFMRSYFYFKSGQYHAQRRNALESRVQAANHMLRWNPSCIGSEADREASVHFRSNLTAYGHRESEGIYALIHEDRSYAIIHLMSGVAAGPSYAFGPIGIFGRIMARSLLKLIAWGLIQLMEWSSTKSLPKIDVSEMFDLLDTFSDPLCRSNLAKILFDLNEHQYKAIAAGNWIRKGIFVPSMSVPSFQTVKLWKTRWGSWVPKLVRNNWKPLRFAPPEVGFGIASSVECEPQPKCTQATKADRANAFFLRITAWKTQTGTLSYKAKPEKSAVRKWNKKKVDQRVYLNDIIMMVEGVGPSHHADNPLELIDKLDKEMKVSLQVMAGFVTFPSLDECTGKILKSSTFTFQKGDTNAPMLTTYDDGMKLVAGKRWARVKNLLANDRVAADVAVQHDRVSKCEGLCLSETACDAIDVEISLASDGSTTVLCRLVQDDSSEEGASSGPPVPTDAHAPSVFVSLDTADKESKSERTCWMRTRLTKGVRPAPVQRPSVGLVARSQPQSSVLVKELLGGREADMDEIKIFTWGDPNIDRGDKNGLIQVTRVIGSKNAAQADRLHVKDIIFKVCDKDVSQKTFIETLMRCANDNGGATSVTIYRPKDER